MPEWILNVCPPTVSRERWHAMNTGQRRAAVKTYWRALRLETRHMLTLKGSEKAARGET